MDHHTELMRQVRFFLRNNPDVIPLHHVEEIIFYGGVDRYVAARGVNIYTEEGSRILHWETALYLFCLELCNLGVGNRPYQPHPYVHDPIIVEPVLEEPAHPEQGQPAAAAPDLANHEQQGVRIVRVDGPFFPPPPPLRPAPAARGPPVQQYSAQPLHWVFREPPRNTEAGPKVEPKTEAVSTEYIEPADEKPGCSH
jgi:hypothetical protein